MIRNKVLIFLFFFLSKVAGFSFSDVLVPYIDFSGDIGKGYCNYWPPYGIGLGDFLEMGYDGISISSGVKSKLPKVPIFLRMAILKGSRKAKRYYHKFPTYASGTFGVILNREMRYELEIAGFYLRNLGSYLSSFLGGYLNMVRKEQMLNWGIAAGIYQGWHKFTEFIIKEKEFFLSGEVILNRWFISPYFNFGLICHLPLEAGKDRYRKKERPLLTFISIGVKAQPSGKNIFNLIDRLSAPKIREEFISGGVK